MTEKITTKKTITAIKKPVLDYGFFAKEVEKELKFEDGEPIFDTEKDMEKYLLYLLLQKISKPAKEDMPLIMPIVHDNRLFKQLFVRVKQEAIDQFNQWANSRGLKETDQRYREVYNLMCKDTGYLNLETGGLKHRHFGYQVQLQKLTDTFKFLLADRSFNQKRYEEQIVYRKKLKQQEKEREEYYAQWD